MAIFKLRNFTLKNGGAFAVRSAITTDAVPLLQHLQRLAGEDSRTIMTSLEEAENITVPQEEAWIQSHLDDPYKIILVAEVDSQIIGLADASSASFIRTKHIARLGMGIAFEYRGQGVGRALMSGLIEWAKNTNQVEKLELQVHTDNAAAIALYKKMGFQTEGTAHKILKYGPGDYKDSFIMGLWLSEVSGSSGPS